MKMTNKIAIELFAIGSKNDYTFIRDTLFPALTKECGVPFILNGYLTLEKKENIKPPPSTGAFFIYTDACKLPLSINKMVSEQVSKLNVPAVFSTSKDAVEIKNHIYESIPPFSVYCETSKLLKKDSIPRVFSFDDFLNLILEEKEKALDFFPCDEIYNNKTHTDTLFKYIQQKVETLCTKELVLTPHCLLNYFKDIPFLITQEPDNPFSLQLIQNWLYAVVKHFGDNKDFSFYSDMYFRHFDIPLTPIHTQYLISLLPNYKPKDITYFLDVDGFSLTYTDGVSLNIKEISTNNLTTDGSFSIESTNLNKIFNLSLNP